MLTGDVGACCQKWILVNSIIPPKRQGTAYLLIAFIRKTMAYHLPVAYWVFAWYKADINLSLVFIHGLTVTTLPYLALLGHILPCIVSMCKLTAWMPNPCGEIFQTDYIDAVWMMHFCRLLQQMPREDSLEGIDFYLSWLIITYSIPQKFETPNSAAWRTCCQGTSWQQVITHLLTMLFNKMHIFLAAFVRKSIC